MRRIFLEKILVFLARSASSLLRRAIVSARLTLSELSHVFPDGHIFTQRAFKLAVINIGILECFKQSFAFQTSRGI